MNRSLKMLYASIKTFIFKTHNCTLFILYLLVAIKNLLWLKESNELFLEHLFQMLSLVGNYRKLQPKKMLHLKKAE